MIKLDETKIITTRDNTGIAPKDCLYMATYGDYDLGCKVGYGATPEEAIEDLKSMMEED